MLSLVEVPFSFKVASRSLPNVLGIDKFAVPNFRTLISNFLGAGCAVRFLKIETRLEIGDRVHTHNTHTLHTCPIHYAHNKNQVGVRQSDSIASKYQLDLRSTMSSPRTGILSLIRFNSGHDKDV